MSLAGRLLVDITCTLIDKIDVISILCYNNQFLFKFESAVPPVQTSIRLLLNIFNNKVCSRNLKTKKNLVHLLQYKLYYINTINDKTYANISVFAGDNSKCSMYIFGLSILA